MKIYRIDGDVEKFQYLSLVDSEGWDAFTFDVFSMIDWVPQECYIMNPKQERGNFFYIAPGTLVFDQRALDGMLDIFEMAGEILPLNVDGEKVFALNVLECPNAFDKKKSKFKFGRSLPEIYSFHPDRLYRSSVFKVPETSQVDIFCSHGVEDEGEFKSRYESLGLTGLIFKELFDSEA